MVHYFRQKGNRYERDEILEKLVHLRMGCADAYVSEEAAAEYSWMSQSADKHDQPIDMENGSAPAGSSSLSDSQA